MLHQSTNVTPPRPRGSITLCVPPTDLKKKDRRARESSYTLLRHVRTLFLSVKNAHISLYSNNCYFPYSDQHQPTQHSEKKTIHVMKTISFLSRTFKKRFTLSFKQLVLNNPNYNCSWTVQINFTVLFSKTEHQFTDEE